MDKETTTHHLNSHENLVKAFTTSSKPATCITYATGLSNSVVLIDVKMDVASPFTFPDGSVADTNRTQRFKVRQSDIPLLIEQLQKYV